MTGGVETAVQLEPDVSGAVDCKWKSDVPFAVHDIVMLLPATAAFKTTGGVVMLPEMLFVRLMVMVSPAAKFLFHSCAKVWSPGVFGMSVSDKVTGASPEISSKTIAYQLPS